MNNEEIIKRNNELFAELAKYNEDTKEYRDIVNKIVANNQPLVIHIAQRFFPLVNNKPSLDDDDLIQEGLMGLSKAIKPFDPAKGVPFGNYAAEYIEGYILRHLGREHRRIPTTSIEKKRKTSKNREEGKIADFLASPFNHEADILDQDERTRQLAWVRKNLDRLDQRERDVLTTKYLSGEASLVGDALAKKFEWTRQYISLVEKKATAKLRKMRNAPQPTALKLTREEKIAVKAVLQNLIATKLPPEQKKAALCKFCSATNKTDRQVAEELNSTAVKIKNNLHYARKKLCTLYHSLPDQKYLPSAAIEDILQFNPAANEKEC